MSNYANSPFGCSGTTVALTLVSLAKAGTYTVLVQDCQNKNTGNFNISGQCTGCLTTPTITWPPPAPITYGTALSSTQLDATANVPGTFVYTPAAGTVLKAGAQTLTAQFTPTNTSLYTTVTASHTLTVNVAKPTVTWTTPAPITYGTALSATELNANANVPGKFVYTPAAGTVLKAGANTLSGTFTPTDTEDYATATLTVALTVNKAASKITWAAAAAITYGTALSANAQLHVNRKRASAHICLHAGCGNRVEGRHEHPQCHLYTHRRDGLLHGECQRESVGQQGDAHDHMANTRANHLRYGDQRHST